MKTTIASILSAMAAMAVVSGFILPNNQGSNSMIGGVHRRQLQQQQQFDHRISSENLLSTATRLLMSETSTRTFERREGGGRGGDTSSYGGRGGRGRGGKFGCTFSFFARGDVCCYFVVFRLSGLVLRHLCTGLDCSIADPFALLLGTE